MSVNGCGSPMLQQPLKRVGKSVLSDTTTRVYPVPCPLQRFFIVVIMDISMFNWRLMVIRYADLPPNAKYLALYLSTYMNEWGDNCFPSIDRIMSETGLARATVCKYLGVLRDSDWLIAKKKGFDGQGWAHNQYFPDIPKKAVQQMNHLTEGSSTDDKRQFNSGQKAVQQTDPIYPITYPITKPSGVSKKMTKRPSTNAWSEWEIWGNENGIKAKTGENMGAYVARLKTVSG